MAELNAKHVKAGNHSLSPPFKKDGYAKGPVPKSMQGYKQGKGKGVKYSGPDVAKGKHV